MVTAETLQIALSALEREMDRREVVARLLIAEDRLFPVVYKRPDFSVKWGALELNLPDNSALEKGARVVADALGLAPDWLDEIPAHGRAAEQPTGIALTLWDHPALTVTGTSPVLALAAKAQAGRDCDRAEIRWLMQRLGLADAESVLELHDAVIPRILRDDDASREWDERVLAAARREPELVQP